MQTKDLDGQVMLFDLDLPCGKMSFMCFNA